MTEHREKVHEKKRLVTGIIVTLITVVLLIFSGPVKAVQVKVRTDKTYYSQNDLVVFSVSVDIETNERMPVQNLTLKIYNGSGVVRQCSFAPQGTSLTACTNILSIDVANIAGYGYGYSLYGYGFGYGYGGWSYYNQTFYNYGYGYGYGYGHVASYLGYDGELAYNITWNISAENLPNGNYSADLWAYASDDQGNVRIYTDEDISEGDNTLTFDNNMPSSNASSAQYDNSGNISVTFSASDIGSGIQSVSLWYRKDNGNWTHSQNTTNASGTLEFEQSGDGIYHFYTVATDIAGNTESKATADTNTTYDTIRPNSTATTSGYDNQGNVTINFTASDNLSGVRNVTLWYKTTASWTNSNLTQSAASGTFDFQPAADANYAFYTIATDNAGNTELKSAADCNSTYDTTAPNSSASSPPFNNSRISIAYSASDATAGVSAVRLYYNKNSTGWVYRNISSSGSGTFEFQPDSDSIYQFYTVATDSAGNNETKATADTTTKYDTVAPNITMRPIGDTQSTLPELYATTNENATCRYMKSGTFTTMQTTGTLTHRQTLNLTVDSYTYTVNCTDPAGNFNHSSISFRVLANETIQSRAGGGGFAKFPLQKTQQDKAEQQWDELQENAVAAMIIDKENISISKIVFRVASKTIEPSISVKVLEILPRQIQEIQYKLYQYLDITTTNILSPNLVKITFRVRLSWLAENNLAAEEIGLYKYTTRWNLLDTGFLYKDKEFAYFEATAGGFSYYAVAQKLTEKIAGPVPEQIIAPTTAVIILLPEEVTLPKEEKPIVWKILVAVVVIVLALGLTVLLVALRSGQKPADVTQQAIQRAKQWIMLAHSRGNTNLRIEEALVRRGWPKDLAKGLIYQVAGPDEVEDPIEEIKDVIASARKHGKTDDQIREAMRHAGWPDWKIDELLI